MSHSAALLSGLALRFALQVPTAQPGRVVTPEGTIYQALYRLPSGLTLRFDNAEPPSRRLLVVRDAITAQLPVDEWARWVHGVRLSDDGLHVGIEFDIGESSDFTLRELDARLRHAVALKLHTKKQYGASARGFERALKLAPGLEVARYYLASALLRQSKRPEAVRALAPLIGEKPLDAYAKLVADGELAPLLDSSAAARLRSALRGTAKLGLDSVLSYPFEKNLHFAAYSSKHRATATVDSQIANPGEAGDGDDDEPAQPNPFRKNLLILDAATGNTLASVPLVKFDDFYEPGWRASKEAVRKRVATANRLLSDLGFSLPADAEVAEVERVEAVEIEKQTEVGLFRKANLKVDTVVTADDPHGTLRVSSGSHQILQKQRVGRLWTAVYFPSIRILLVHWVFRHCGDLAPTCAMGVEQFRLPPIEVGSTN